MTAGNEDYARYYYLWHLVAIKALTVKAPPPADGETCPEIDSAIWDFTGPALAEAKIALIDMGVAPHHPNLKAPDTGPVPADRVIRDEALDLASHPFGVKYIDRSAVGAGAEHIEEHVQHLSGIQNPLGIPGLTSQEQRVIAGLRSGFGVKRYIDAYDDRYAGHGTSCAGLACGTSFAADQFGNTGNIAAYYGVDPKSRVIPITTSISPSPEELIAAFLYAHEKDVHVILFPRDIANPDHWPGYDDRPATVTEPFYPGLDRHEKTRLHETMRDEPDGDARDISVAWSTLHKVVEWVSTKIPVVCAAGNDGRSELIYPASLSGDPANGIISVGAVNYNGYRSGYSNYSADLTVSAPSDDGEIYNRYQIRLDRDAASATDFHLEDRAALPKHHLKRDGSGDAIPIVDFAPQRLVTLDVPGPRGYVEGSLAAAVETRKKAVDDPAGLYTEFGGTSGASALVAGAIAMMQRKSPNVLNGVQIKAIFKNLETSATRFNNAHWYWSSAAGTLQADAINGYTPPPRAELFGVAGLLDVPLLLTKV
ncbi:S8 family serine peptidase [Ruegeria sp. HKCCSP351]|uniref:S8 family serine peptidase n=1 Tax=Ruegeria sp. HKCCSP351 TaxID=2794832 RepID=UPI001AE7E4F2|nr:S8 family serine peptidase [Ruegeria sp. HKCCSP351]